MGVFVGIGVCVGVLVGNGLGAKGVIELIKVTVGFCVGFSESIGVVFCDVCVQPNEKINGIQMINNLIFIGILCPFLDQCKQVPDSFAG